MSPRLDFDRSSNEAATVHDPARQSSRPWPLAARAQRMQRIGVLMGYPKAICRAANVVALQAAA